MKELIPFTLERWQQGNCTPKTADGREVKKFIDFETHGLRYGGVVDGKIRNWLNDGSSSIFGISHNDLMLEVDC